MIDRKISIRYAKALDKICEDNKLSERDTLESLNHLINVLSNNKELNEFLGMSIISMDKRLEIVDELLSSGKNLYIKKFIRKDIADKLIGKESNFYIKEFVKYMLKKRRFSLLADVVEIFEELVNKKENRLKATVISAVKLSESEKDELKSSLETKFNKTIEFEFTVNKELIAGIIVKIDDIVYDGSINTYINNLERKLLKLPL